MLDNLTKITVNHLRCLFPTILTVAPKLASSIGKVTEATGGGVGVGAPSILLTKINPGRAASSALTLVRSTPFSRKVNSLRIIVE